MYLNIRDASNEKARSFSTLNKPKCEGDENIELVVNCKTNGAASKEYTTEAAPPPPLQIISHI